MSSIILPEAAPLQQRCSPSEIETQRKSILENTFLMDVLNSFPDLVAVLNRHRQIVYANKTFTDLLGPINSLDIFGKRPGEALDCQQAFKSEYGCGTTESCSTCGAAKAISACKQHQKENLRNAASPRKQQDLPWSFGSRRPRYPITITDSLFYFSRTLPMKNDAGLWNVYFFMM
jgi:hypothetical protein